MVNKIKLGKNRIASEYIEEHYVELVRYANAHTTKVDAGSDAVNDMWITLIEQENAGEGYDESLGHDGDISVEMFIYSRLKGYCKNKKYNGGDEREVLFSTKEDKDDDYGYRPVKVLNDISKDAIAYESEFEDEEEFLYMLQDLCVIERFKNFFMNIDYYIQEGIVSSKEALRSILGEEIDNREVAYEFGRCMEYIISKQNR